MRFVSITFLLSISLRFCDYHKGLWGELHRMISDWQMTGICTSSFNSKQLLNRWKYAWQNVLLVCHLPPNKMISNWANSSQRKQNAKIKDERQKWKTELTKQEWNHPVLPLQSIGNSTGYTFQTGFFHRCHFSQKAEKIWVKA